MVHESVRLNDFIGTALKWALVAYFEDDRVTADNERYSTSAVMVLMTNALHISWCCCALSPIVSDVQ